jgi:CRISPR-associated protein (TIGR03984 family)
MTILYGRASENITLLQALEQCQNVLAKAIALLYTPTHCLFAQVSSAANQTVALLNANGQAIALTDIFEARVFNPTAELRWLNDRNGSGRAVLLSEDNAISAYLETTVAEVPDLELAGLPKQSLLITLDQTYILWGQGTQKQPDTLRTGWSRLASARIGKLDVPLANVKHLQYVKLKVREYLQTVDEHGNVAVVEERLVALEVA